MGWLAARCILGIECEVGLSQTGSPYTQHLEGRTYRVRPSRC